MSGLVNHKVIVLTLSHIIGIFNEYIGSKFSKLRKTRQLKWQFFKVWKRIQNLII